jgi:hypothetical protein
MPTSPVVGTARPVSVPAGPYLLMMTPSTSGLSSPSFCSGTLWTTPVRLEVNAERTSDVATLRAAGPNTNLVVEFRIMGATVLGAISGSASDTVGNRITADGQVTGAAPPDLAVSVAGNITGSISAGDGFCSNNGHTWSLSAR